MICESRFEYRLESEVDFIEGAVRCMLDIDHNGSHKAALRTAIIRFDDQGELIR